MILVVWERFIFVLHIKRTWLIKTWTDKIILLLWAANSISCGIVTRNIAVKIVSWVENLQNYIGTWCVNCIIQYWIWENLCSAHYSFCCFVVSRSLNGPQFNPIQSLWMVLLMDFCDPKMAFLFIFLSDVISKHFHSQSHNTLDTTIFFFVRTGV